MDPQDPIGGIGDDAIDKDIGHQSEEEELSDSESEGATSAPRTSPRGDKDNGCNAGGYFTDLSYLRSLSRNERRIIEEEMIKGCKPGEYKPITLQ